MHAIARGGGILLVLGITLVLAEAFARAVNVIFPLGRASSGANPGKTTTLRSLALIYIRMKN
jgi:hypothetical protein